MGAPNALAALDIFSFREQNHDKLALVLPPILNFVSTSRHLLFCRRSVIILIWKITERQKYREINKKIFLFFLCTLTYWIHSPIFRSAIFMLAARIAIPMVAIVVTKDKYICLTVWME